MDRRWPERTFRSDVLHRAELASRENQEGENRWSMRTEIEKAQLTPRLSEQKHNFQNGHLTISGHLFELGRGGRQIVLS